MNNFEGYQPPGSALVENEPQVVRDFTELVRERLPIPLSMLPEDVTEITVERIAEKNKRVRIAEYRGVKEEAGVVIGNYYGYQVEVIEEFYRRETDVTPMLIRERVVDVNPDAGVISLMAFSEMHFDEDGDYIVPEEEAMFEIPDGSGYDENEEATSKKKKFVVSDLEEMSGVIVKVPSKWSY